MEKLATGSNPLPYINEFTTSTVVYDAVLDDGDYVVRFSAAKRRGVIHSPKWQGSFTFDLQFKVTSLAGDRRPPESLLVHLRECGFLI